MLRLFEQCLQFSQRLGDRWRFELRFGPRNINKLLRQPKRHGLGDDGRIIGQNNVRLVGQLVLGKRQRADRDDEYKPPC